MKCLKVVKWTVVLKRNELYQAWKDMEEPYMGTVCMLSHFSCVRFFSTPWTIAHQAPLSVDSLGRNIIVGCCALLQGILPTQGLNLRLLWLLHCRQILYCWANGEALNMCYWVKEANLKRQYTVWFQLCMTFCKRQNCQKRAEKNCVVARGSGKGWTDRALRIFRVVKLLCMIL